MTALTDSRHHRSLTEDPRPRRAGNSGCSTRYPSPSNRSLNGCTARAPSASKPRRRLEPLAEGPEVSPPRAGVQAPAEHLGPHRLALLDAKIF